MENDKLPPKRPLPEWLPAVPSTSAGPPSSKVSERRSRLKKHTKPLAVVSPQQHGNTVLPIERPVDNMPGESKKSISDFAVQKFMSNSNVVELIKEDMKKTGQGNLQSLTKYARIILEKIHNKSLITYVSSRSNLDFLKDLRYNSLKDNLEIKLLVSNPSIENEALLNHHQNYLQSHKVDKLFPYIDMTMNNKALVLEKSIMKKIMSNYPDNLIKKKKTVSTEIVRNYNENCRQRTMSSSTAQYVIDAPVHPIPANSDTPSEIQICESHSSTQLSSTPTNAKMNDFISFEDFVKSTNVFDICKECFACHDDITIDSIMKRLHYAYTQVPESRNRGMVSKIVFKENSLSSKEPPINNDSTNLISSIIIEDTQEQPSQPKSNDNAGDKSKSNLKKVIKIFRDNTNVEVLIQTKYEEIRTNSDILELKVENLAKKVKRFFYRYIMNQKTYPSCLEFTNGWSAQTFLALQDLLLDENKNSNKFHEASENILVNEDNLIENVIVLSSDEEETPQNSNLKINTQKNTQKLPDSNNDQRVQQSQMDSIECRLFQLHEGISQNTNVERTKKHAAAGPKSSKSWLKLDDAIVRSNTSSFCNNYKESDVDQISHDKFDQRVQQSQMDSIECRLFQLHEGISQNTNVERTKKHAAAGPKSSKSWLKLDDAIVRGNTSSFCNNYKESDVDQISHDKFEDDMLATSTQIQNIFTNLEPNQNSQDSLVHKEKSSASKVIKVDKIPPLTSNNNEQTLKITTTNSSNVIPNIKRESSSAIMNDCSGVQEVNCIVEPILISDSDSEIELNVPYRVGVDSLLANFEKNNMIKRRNDSDNSPCDDGNINTETDTTTFQLLNSQFSLFLSSQLDENLKNNYEFDKNKKSNVVKIDKRTKKVNDGYEKISKFKLRHNAIVNKTTNNEYFNYLRIRKFEYIHKKYGNFIFNLSAFYNCSGLFQIYFSDEKIRELLNLNSCQWLALRNILSQIRKFEYKSNDKNVIRCTLLHRLLFYFFRTTPKVANINVMLDKYSDNVVFCTRKCSPSDNISSDIVKAINPAIRLRMLKESHMLKK